MDELINYKLTYITPNGAEGYNSKFNDVVNSLEQQGQVLELKILKGIYLGKIKDMYHNIKDNAAAAGTLITLPEIQAQTLQKYLAMQSERRIGAPSYAQRRLVNTTYSKHVKFKVDEDEDFSDNPSVGIRLGRPSSVRSGQCTSLHRLCLQDFW